MYVYMMDTLFIHRSSMMLIHIYIYDRRIPICCISYDDLCIYIGVCVCDHRHVINIFVWPSSSL